MTTLFAIYFYGVLTGGVFLVLMSIRNRIRGRRRLLHALGYLMGERFNWLTEGEAQSALDAGDIIYQLLSDHFGAPRFSRDALLAMRKAAGLEK